MAMQVPREWPLVFLVKASWKEGKCLGCKGGKAMDSGLRCCIITAVQFPVLHILHFRVTCGIFEVPIPEGQAGTVGNFQRAKILRILIINTVSRIRLAHNFCLSACLHISLSVFQFVRLPIRPSSQPPPCLLRHPSLPPHYNPTNLNPYVCLCKIQSVVYKYINSLNRLRCCRPYLHLGTFRWQCIF